MIPSASTQAWAAKGGSRRAPTHQVGHWPRNRQSRTVASDRGTHPSRDAHARLTATTVSRAPFACSKLAGLAPRRSQPSTVRMRRGDWVASSRAAATATRATIRRGSGTDLGRWKTASGVVTAPSSKVAVGAGPSRCASVGHQAGRAESAQQVLDVPARRVGVDVVAVDERLRRVRRRAALQQGPQHQGTGGVEVPVLAAVLVEQRYPVIGVGGRHTITQLQRHASLLTTLRSNVPASAATPRTPRSGKAPRAAGGAGSAGCTVRAAPPRRPGPAGRAASPPRARGSRRGAAAGRAPRPRSHWLWSGG